MHIKKILLLCLMVSFFTSCKKEENIVGKNIIPEGEDIELQYTDTLTLSAFSTKDDSIITDEMSLNLLGFVSDPMFGYTQADIYSQFRLTENALDFGENADLDSIILTLSYKGFFGDTLHPFEIKVYELDESLDIEKNYYSTSTLSYQPDNLTEATSYQCYPKPNTINKNDSSQTSPIIRIPLKKSFGKAKFMDKSGDDELSNNDKFLAYFKGLLIQAQAISNNGSMVYVDMLDAISSLTIYYHNDQKTNLKHSFIANKSAERFSAINHFDYTNANTAIKKQIIEKDYSEAEENLFVQASGGVKTLIHFPYLQSMFKGKKVMIYKAELVVTRHEGDYSVFFQPPALDLYYKKDSTVSTSYYLPDYLMGPEHFGGIYNKKTNEYRFRITQYVQKLLLEETANHPLHLVVKGAATKANRMMLYGVNPKNNKNRLRLELTYSFINE